MSTLTNRAAPIACALESFGIEFHHVPMGLAVSHPLFVKPDQDRAGCYISGPDEAGKFKIECAGDTLLDGSGDPAEATLIAFAAGLQAEWDVVDFQFTRTFISRDDLPRAVMQFLLTLTRIAEMQVTPMTRPVQVGDRVRDNRRPERVVNVCAIVGAEFVLTEIERADGFHCGPDIRLDRIHTDGRIDRRSGWSLVREEG